MRHGVLYTKQAQWDLKEIRSYITRESSARIASRYIKRLKASCADLVMFPNRGTLHDQVRPGMRIVGFERRVTIQFTVQENLVYILGFAYAGLNWTESKRSDSNDI